MSQIVLSRKSKLPYLPEMMMDKHKPINGPLYIPGKTAKNQATMQF